jgi:hypothetical protein
MMACKTYASVLGTRILVVAVSRIKTFCSIALAGAHPRRTNDTFVVVSPDVAIIASRVDGALVLACPVHTGIVRAWVLVVAVLVIFAHHRYSHTNTCATLKDAYIILGRRISVRAGQPLIAVVATLALPVAIIHSARIQVIAVIVRIALLLSLAYAT